MSYCTVDDVLNSTGLDVDRIQKLSPRTPSASQVNALIQGYIDDAQKEIREIMKIDSMINKELHLCTGQDDIFELGPEDEPESFINYTVSGNLVECFNLYLGGDCPNLRRLRPYPTNCELGTENDAAHWKGTGTAVITALTSPKKAGSYSIKMDFVAVVDTAIYPNISATVPEWIDEDIDMYSFMAFYLYCEVANTTITFKLYNSAGNSNVATYTAIKAKHWYLVMLDIDDDFTGTVDWEDDNLMYIEFSSDTIQEVIIDNLNFNDYWMFTAPAGEVALMHNSNEEEHELGYPFYVSYNFDPFLANVPRNIKKACACLAGVDLIDFMRGIRMEDTEYDAEAESGIATTSRDQFSIMRESLLKKANEALAATGFGFDFTPVDV